jgi:hypothetical protein
VEIGFIWTTGASPLYRLVVDYDDGIDPSRWQVTVAVENLAGNPPVPSASDLLDALETYFASLPDYDATVSRATVDTEVTPS